MWTPRQMPQPLCIVYAALMARSIVVSPFLHSAPFSCSPSTNPRASARVYSTQRVDPTSTDTLAVPPGVLGPPEPLRSLEVGQRINAFRALQYDDEAERLQFTIERVSDAPDVFHLRNFVTASECKEIVSAAKSVGMEQAGTITKDDASSRKRCSVAWIPSNADDKSTISSIVCDLVSSTVNIFLSHGVLSQPSAGVEDLQVLEYRAGGEFVHHHDGEPRILTVIYYVNGVGGTWFPLADANGREPQNKDQALNLVDGLEPGSDGLLVKGSGKDNNDDDDRGEEESGYVARVKRGDAIAFYNYKDDGSGELDWRALHCGLPTTEEEGTKWIANHWYRLNTLADM